VAFDGRRGESGHLVCRKSGRGVADQVSRTSPAGAEHQGDIVTVDVCLLGDVLGRATRSVKGISVKGISVPEFSITHWYKLSCRRRPAQ
jgi:hypothetical protein